MLFLALAIFLGVFDIYLLTATKNYSPDGMAFTTLITQGNFRNPLFFQAEHLLYPLFGWIWFQSWVFIGYPEGALVPLQILNSFLGAAGIGFFFLCAVLALGKTREGVFFALVASLLVGSSYGYWMHSTDVEDQIGSNALVMLSFLFLLKGLRSDGFSNRSLFYLAGAMGGAVLIHATQVLFLPVICLGLLFQRRFRSLLIFLLAFSVVIGVAYLLVGTFVMGYRSVGDYLSWALAAPGKGVWGRFGLRNFWQGSQAYTESLMYLQGGISFNSILKGGDWRNLLGIGIFSGTMLLTVLSVAHGIYHRKRIGSWRMNIFWLCLFWAVLYAAFNFYWAPEDVQFWIAVITPALLIFAITYYDTFQSFVKWQEFLRGLFLFTLAAVFLINLATAFVPRADLESNEGYRQAIFIRDHTDPEDLIIAPGWDWAGSYVPYFSQRKIVTIIDTYILSAGGNREKATTEIKKEIAATLQKGRRVYVVRLYNMDENDRAYFTRVTGYSPEDFDFRRELAWHSGKEEAWEILALERGS